MAITISDPVDISTNVQMLIRALGLDPADVRTITLDATTPHVVVTLYQRNSEGTKYCDDNGDPATTDITIPATTRGEFEWR